MMCDSKTPSDRKPVARPVYVSLGMVVIAFVNTSLFTCLCGAIGGEALVGNVIATVVAWRILTGRHEASVPERVVLCVSAAIASAFLGLTVINVLWTGHGVLFAEPIERHTASVLFFTLAVLATLGAGVAWYRSVDERTRSPQAEEVEEIDDVD